MTRWEFAVVAGIVGFLLYRVLRTFAEQLETMTGLLEAIEAHLDRLVNGPDEDEDNSEDDITELSPPSVLNPRSAP